MGSRSGDKGFDCLRESLSLTEEPSGCTAGGDSANHNGSGGEASGDCLAPLSHCLGLNWKGGWGGLPQE